MRATTSGRLFLSYSLLFAGSVCLLSLVGGSSISAAKGAAASGSTPILIVSYDASGRPAYLASLAPDGSGVMRRLAAGRGCAGINDGVWAPNHKRVAFVRGGFDCATGRRLYVKGIRGGPEWRIGRQAGIDSFDWAPDSRRLVYDDFDRLLVTTFQGAGPHVVARGNPASEPAWSPDGKQIAYVRETVQLTDELWVVRPDGTHRRRLTPTGEASISELGWSADSTRLVFEVGDPESRAGIYIIGLEGRGPRLIAAGGPGAADMPQWAPRGTALAYRLWTDCGLKHNKKSCARIVVRRNLAARPQPIETAAGAEHDMDFAWSPDGTRIVFGRSEITESGDVTIGGLYVKTLGRSRLTLVLRGGAATLEDW